MVTGTPAGAENTPLRRTENRRSNKPIMEKRRRARINNCLNELKSLILDALKKDPARHSKLEKADILEMTVKHVESLQRHQAALSAAADPSVLNKFKAGWSECVTEVGRFPGIEAAVKRRLMDHLSTCLDTTDRRTPSPSQQQHQQVLQSYQLSPTAGSGVATTGSGGTVTAIITTSSPPSMSSSCSSSSTPSPPPLATGPMLTAAATLTTTIGPQSQPHITTITATCAAISPTSPPPTTVHHQQHQHHPQQQQQHHHHHHHNHQHQQHHHHQPVAAATAAQIIQRRDTGGVLALVPTRLSNGDIALVLPSPPPLVPAASQQPLCLAISKQGIEKPWRPW